MIKVAIMNLYLHGLELENANIRYHDLLTLPTENDRKYDIILANPPFAGHGFMRLQVMVTVLMIKQIPGPIKTIFQTFLKNGKQSP
jgi:type I restriction-modification system DNA methylase subunit